MSCVDSSNTLNTKFQDLYNKLENLNNTEIIRRLQEIDRVLKDAQTSCQVNSIDLSPVILGLENNECILDLKQIKLSIKSIINDRKQKNELNLLSHIEILITSLEDSITQCNLPIPSSVISNETLRCLSADDGYVLSISNLF